MTAKVPGQGEVWLSSEATVIHWLRRKPLATRCLGCVHDPQIMGFCCYLCQFLHGKWREAVFLWCPQNIDQESAVGLGECCQRAGSRPWRVFTDCCAPWLTANAVGVFLVGKAPAQLSVSAESAHCLSSLPVPVAPCCMTRASHCYPVLPQWDRRVVLQRAQQREDEIWVAAEWQWAEDLRGLH